MKMAKNTVKELEKFFEKKIDWGKKSIWDVFDEIDNMIEHRTNEIMDKKDDNSALDFLINVKGLMATRLLCENVAEVENEDEKNTLIMISEEAMKLTTRNFMRIVHNKEIDDTEKQTYFG